MSFWHHLRNVLSNYGQVISAALVALIITPPLFHHLGPTDYAILAFALIVESLLEKTDFGMMWALVRYVSYFSERGWELETRKLVSSVFFLLSGVGVLYACLLAILSPSLAKFFRVSSAGSAPGFLIVAIVGSSLGFQLPSTALRGLLFGRQDFHLANAVDIPFQWIRGGAILLVLFRGGGLVPLAILYPAASLLRLVGLLIVSRRSRNDFRPRVSEIDIESFRHIRKFASLSFPEELVERFFGQLDSFIAARFLPLPQLSILVIARRFPQALSMLIHQSLSIAYPIVSAADARQDRESARRYVLLMTRNVLAVVVPLTFILYFWAGLLLQLWVGPEVLSGIPVFRAYVAFAAFATLAEVPLVLLYGQGRLRFSAAVSAVLFTTSIVLGPWACNRGGLVGMALTLAAMQTLATVLLFWKVLRLTGVTWITWFNRAILPTLLSAPPTVAWLWFTYSCFPPTLLGILLSSLTSLVLFSGIFVGLVTGLRRMGWKDRLRRLFIEI
jgi:O-antigen/teichoic acid export membrane protein